MGNIILRYIKMVYW